MLTVFIDQISSNLLRLGYITQIEPGIPGIQGLLYAHSPSPFRLGVAKVTDHFLYIDWENASFSRKDMLLEFFKQFSKYVNQGYRVPHALRINIPNLVMIAISENEFTPEIIQFVATTYLTPWYGGETGQLILIELRRKNIYCHKPPKFKEPGSLPLSHGAEIIINTSWG